MVMFNLIEPFEVFRVPDVDELRHDQADHEHLPDFFLERELLEGLLRPLFTAVVKMYSGGALEVCSKRKRKKCQNKNQVQEQLSPHERNNIRNGMPSRRQIHPGQTVVTMVPAHTRLFYRVLLTG